MIIRTDKWMTFGVYKKGSVFKSIQFKNKFLANIETIRVLE